MKRFSKILATLASLALLGVFIGCDDGSSGGNGNSGDGGSDGGSNSSAYSISVEKSSLTIAPGGTEVVSVTASGYFTASSSNDKVTATASYSAKTVTIKADASLAETTNVTVTLKLNDDASKTATIAVTVDPEAEVKIDAYELTLTLTSDVAAKAAAITVYAEGKEDSEETATLYQTVSAEYTPGETTAVAKLDKAKANSWKYFNNIVVTVKDSNGNAIAVESSPVYFDYSDTEFTGITVSAKTTSKTFTINFEGFTIVGGSVTGLKVSNTWYSSKSDWVESTTLSPTVTVAADGASASFDINSSDLTSKNEFYVDWTSAVVKNSAGTELSINSGNTESNKWYSYSGDDWSNTFAVVSAVSATRVSSDTVTIEAEGTYQLAVSYDAIKNYSTVYITFAAITAWGDGSYDKPCLGTDAATWKADTAWVESTAFVDSNVVSETGGYYASISPSDYPNGVFITGKTGLAGTLFVSGLTASN